MVLSIALLVSIVACAAPSREVPTAEPAAEAAPQEAGEVASDPGPAGEEAEAPPLVIPRFLQTYFELEPTATYLFPAELSGGDAKVATTGAGVGFRGSMPLDRTTVVGAELGYDWRDYAFSGTSADLPGAERPFDGLHTWRTVLTWLQVLGQDWQEDWQLYARGSLQASAESGAKLSDGLSYGVLLVFGKQWTPDLRLGFGVAGFSRLETDPIAFPALQLVWDMAESWTMSLVGPELVITKRFDERRDLAFVAEYEYRFYRLKSSGPTQGGTFGDQRFPLAVRYTQALGENSRFRVWGGLDVYRRLEFDLDEGDRLDRADASPSPFLGLSLLLGF